MNMLRDSYKDIALDGRRFEECLADLRQHRAWEKVPVDKPYGTGEDGKPVWCGAQGDGRLNRPALCSKHTKPTVADLPILCYAQLWSNE